MLMYAYVRLCMLMYAYVCLCMLMYAYVCLCMLMYAYVCLCVFGEHWMHELWSQLRLSNHAFWCPFKETRGLLHHKHTKMVVMCSKCKSFCLDIKTAKIQLPFSRPSIRKESLLLMLQPYWRLYCRHRPCEALASS